MTLVNRSSNANLSLLEKLSATSLVVGTLTSIISQQLVYALAPLPLTVGVNQLLRRRSLLEQLADRNQAVVTHVIQQEISPIITQVSGMQKQLAHFSTYTNYINESYQTLHLLKTQLLEVQQQFETKRQLEEQEQLLAALQDRLQLQQQEKQKFEEALLQEIERLTAQYQLLKSQNIELAKERDDFQLKTWELTEQLQQLVQSIDSQGQAEVAVVTPPETTGSLTYEAVDLSRVKLAIVGGRQDMRREVIDTLCQEHGLKSYVEIPASFEQKTNRQKVKEKIHNCDKVVVITGYICHGLTNIVSDLQKSKALKGEVLMVNCQGKSGVVREILARCPVVV